MIRTMSSLPEEVYYL